MKTFYPSCLLALLSVASACDNDASVAEGSLQQPDTVTINPGDLRGKVVVDAPPETKLSDYKPGSESSSYYGGKLEYASGKFHVYDENRGWMATAELGTPVAVPEGSYWVVVNDTYKDVKVTRDKTTRVACGRLEVNHPAKDVAGTFSVAAEYDWDPDTDYKDESATHNHWILGRTHSTTFIPTGVGINVLPGRYSLRVDYQRHAKYFEVVVKDDYAAKR